MSQRQAKLMYHWSMFIVRCKLREFAVASNGWMVLVPKFTEPGDTIHFFQGAKTPFVLRRINNV